MTSKEYYAEHRDEISKRAKAYYAAHPEIFKGYREKNKDRNKVYAKEYRETHREYQNAASKANNKKTRIAALSVYSQGVPHCACCGETAVEFLAIDHIDGGGLEHRRQIGSGGGPIYYWLKKNNYPKGFRVLCHNCNQSMGHYGYCPHKGEETSRSQAPIILSAKLSDDDENMALAAIKRVIGYVSKKEGR